MINKTACINGVKYTLEEILPAVGGAEIVICRNDDQIRIACLMELWQANALQENCPSGTVNTNSPASDKIALFRAAFRGREDVYAKRYFNLKTERSGYVPACQNEWAAGICDKRANKCPACPNREFVPLTDEVIRAHLIGRDPHCRDVVGLYPMLEGDLTWLLAADFDEAAWRDDVAAFRAVATEYGLVPAVERSRSGNGAHVWFFFSEPVSAADARKLGTGLLTRTMARRHELKFTSYDRLFPSQDTMPKGGFGNLIALPFQGQAQKNGNTLFVDEQFVPYPDQWAFLSALPKITPEQLAEVLAQVCAGGDLGQLAKEEPEAQPWPVKKAKRRLARADFPVQARLMISDLLYVDKTGFSQPALNAIKRLAAFRNPDFFKKQAMRMRVYGIPRVFDCGYEDADCLGVPRGCRDELTELLEGFDVPYALEDRRQSGRTIDAAFNGTLRPEQIPAAESLLQEDTGVLSATTAFGKTVVGAYLIGARKVNTLVLVHSSALLEQWKKALGQFLTINEVLPEQPNRRGRKKKQYLIGQIGGGKNTRSGIVDIAIMQSLFEGEEKDVKPFVAEYGMVICDECHHVAAFTFEKILRTVKAKYVYGLSATPVRSDGHQPIIFMQCGPIRYLVDAKEQAAARSFSHFVIPRFTRTRLPKADRMQDYYAGIVTNSGRNEMILTDTRKLLQEGRTPILLTERKDHAKLLAEALEKEQDHVFLLLGSDSQKMKQEKLTQLRETPPDVPLVIVATGKYIGEGFDEPRLDTMQLCMPVSWKGTLAQYAGRLHRSYEGKHEVRIYDYVDVHVPSLERMYHKRLRGYAELGYQGRTSDREEEPSRVYDRGTCTEPFAADLSEAARSILIVSPFVQKGRLETLMPILEKAASTGVSVCVLSRPAACYRPDQQEAVRLLLASLEDVGVQVREQMDLCQRFAVIDQSVVWYGSIDLLAYGKTDSDVLRFEDAEVAGELSELFDEY